MQSWKLRRQGNKTLKNRLSEEGLGKQEELCCCCVACSVSVVPCVWPQSEGMVVFSLLRWMRQPGNKMCCVLGLPEPWPGAAVSCSGLFSP